MKTTKEIDNPSDVGFESVFNGFFAGISGILTKKLGFFAGCSHFIS